MIVCLNKCGKELAEDQVASSGWTWLPVAGAYRCGACVRLMLEVSKLRGVEGETPDLLPKDSRGALPKETASTITPPSNIR